MARMVLCGNHRMNKFTREVILDKVYQVVEVPDGAKITVTSEGGECAAELTSSSKTAPVSSTTLAAPTEYVSTKTKKYLWVCGSGKVVIEG